MRHIYNSPVLLSRQSCHSFLATAVMNSKSMAMDFAHRPPASQQNVPARVIQKPRPVRSVAPLSRSEADTSDQFLRVELGPVRPDRRAVVRLEPGPDAELDARAQSLPGQELVSREN